MTGPIGVLLCGGEARRMGGGDKPLLPLAGHPLLAHLVARAAPQVERLVISVHGEAAAYAAFALPLVRDAGNEHAGPLAGILAAMRWAERHAPGADIVSLPGDTPFIPADLVARLMSARTPGGLACAASAGRRHPAIGLWPVALAAALAEALAAGIRKIDAWTAPYGVAVATWPATPTDPFFNVNHPADLARAERLASAL